MTISSALKALVHGPPDAVERFARRAHFSLKDERRSGSKVHILDRLEPPRELDKRNRYTVKIGLPVMVQGYAKDREVGAHVRVGR